MGSVATTANGITNFVKCTDGSIMAVTATGITGDNSATWSPTINVAIPGGIAAGVYSATITHSVL